MKNTTLLSCAALAAAPILSLGLTAQSPATAKVQRPVLVQPDVKTPRTADPVKGFGPVTELTAGERAMGRRPHADGPVAQQIVNGRSSGFDPGVVLYSNETDGRTWANGATYKASFGADGFTYVPFLGAKAPRNFPVRFTIASVKAGGVDVAFAREAAPVRTGDRIVFDRGNVREVYDLRGGQIEQTFEVAGVLPGDVVVELAIASELGEDATLPGLQFRNELGGVDYGTAYLVDGVAKREIASTFANGTLSLRVPAALRAAERAVVIDPVLSTHTTSSTASQDFDDPDVAFDATTNRYLVVWQRNFSATDIDVWCEMRDINGAFVSGTAQLIENSGNVYWSKPRVANLNLHDRFLVVAEQYVASNPAGQRYTVWGRTVNAASPFTLGSAFLISGAQGGEKRSPDVGGDPNSAGPVYWTVAYTREVSATDHDIHARQVGATGNVQAATIFIENSSDTIHRDVQISLSNGDIGAQSQAWLLVYGYKFSDTDWDVYGASLSWDGNVIQPSIGIDTTTTSHFGPQVSSATHALPNSPLFAVTYEDGSNINDLRGKVVRSNLASVVGSTNLSTLLGTVGNIYAPRVETDGTRFAVVYALGQPAYAATLAVIGNSFVVHETPKQVGTGIDAYDFNIASRASGGGSNTGYGIVMSDELATPDRIVFGLYEGHAAGGFTIRQTGCNGLGMTATGTAFLGRTATGTLTGVGSDLVGMLVGLPGPALALCSNCVIGVNMAGPLINVPNASSLNLPIPTQTHIVGVTLTMQGYSVGSGPCFGALRLSHSLDIKIQ